MYLQEKPFTNNTLSLNASANLFLIEKTQEHNLLKEFIQIKIYCHCGKCEKEKKKANSYQCNFFTESENKATEVKDLQKNFRTNLTELILGKVLIVSIEEVECDFPKGKSHATVLVISREEYSFRAFYCDSNGFNMPPVLRAFLEETFTEMINEGYIKKYYLDYSSKRQQKISSGCAIFSIINSAYISDRILKKASFREIRKALYYQPSECYFKEKTQEFFNFFDKRFCCYLVEKIDTLIDSLDIFLEKVYSTALSTDRINIKYNREKLKKLVVILKSLLEAEKNFNGIERKDFFSREFSVCNHKNKQQCFYKEGCFF